MIETRKEYIIIYMVFNVWGKYGVPLSVNHASTIKVCASLYLFLIQLYKLAMCLLQIKSNFVQTSQLCFSSQLSPKKHRGQIIGQNFNFCGAPVTP